MYYIYKITNLVNNKIYIGQTCQNPPEKRWSNHRTAGKNPKSRMAITLAIHKYGENNFIFEVIASCITNNRDEIDLLEEEVIKQYGSRERGIGYNIQPGGKTLREYKRGPYNNRKLKGIIVDNIIIDFKSGMTISAITRKYNLPKNNRKCVRAVIPNELLEERKANPVKNVCSDEQKINISKVMMGNKFWLGRKHTEESKKKNAEANTKYHLTEEQKISIKNDTRPYHVIAKEYGMKSLATVRKIKGV